MTACGRGAYLGRTWVAVRLRPGPMAGCGCAHARAESALTLMGVAGIVGALTRATQLSGLQLAALLVFPTLGMAAAPFNSWAAQRAALPQELRERRRTEYRRDRRAFAAGAATGGVVAVLGVAAAALILLFARSPQTVQTPSLIAPAQGHTPTS